MLPRPRLTNVPLARQPHTTRFARLFALSHGRVRSHLTSRQEGPAPSFCVASRSKRSYSEREADNNRRQRVSTDSMVTTTVVSPRLARPARRKALLGGSSGFGGRSARARPAVTDRAVYVLIILSLLASTQAGFFKRRRATAGTSSGSTRAEAKDKVGRCGVSTAQYVCVCFVPCACKHRYCARDGTRSVWGVGGCSSHRTTGVHV